MIEEIVIDYLRDTFPDEIVSAEVPSPMPPRFITVEKTGSQQIGIGLFQSTVAVQSWETEGNKLEAARLSERVCEALRSLPDVSDEVTRARGADYDFTETTVKRPRYQALFTFTHY